MQNGREKSETEKRIQSVNISIINSIVHKTETFN